MEWRCWTTADDLARMRTRTRTMKGARNSCPAECQKRMTRGERASCGGKLREGGQGKVRQSEVVGMLQLVFLRWNK